MLAAFLFASVGRGRDLDALAAGFKSPLLSARPQTWWHWMNGNVTKAGISADLAAMKSVGIGGAQMFTVDQGIPAGSAGYGGAKWRELTAFAVSEAARLGLELCLHNCAGWSSSGGPWVNPEDGMQVLAWSSVKVKGPAAFSQTLPPIEAPRVDSVVPYCRDIAVYAYRTPPAGDIVEPRPADFLQKTGVVRGEGLKIDPSPLVQPIAIRSSDLTMLTEKIDPSGHLTWQVPEGDWTILRMGYVPTGVHNHPAPQEGDGLEVDKLSKEALDRHWSALVGKVLADIGPKGTATLNNVLIDSYEVGTQNWTPRFREEFQRRRGYDPLPYLPVVAGRIVDDKLRSERFLWDLRRTIADLYADNYYGHMAELAHRNGIEFSTEPYGNGGFDTMPSGGRADIPMGEFWLGGAAMETTKLASSIAHTYGRRVVGAESFTSDTMPGRWREEPYAMKALGDLAFCNGINRYIFHRYAMQPWLDLKPGMTMGPWGTHLERTQTWWTEAATWLKYVARCQYLLQAGSFQADVCYFVGEGSPNDLAGRAALKPSLPEGYDYDGCDEATLKRMSVREGRIVLPSGMSYRMLVLPNTPFITPTLARKLKELVAAGATVYGPKPTGSPSLTDYPACDVEVRSIADELWGEGDDSKSYTNHVYGQGRVVSNIPGNALGAILKNVPPDFAYAHRSASGKLVDIHRRFGNADVYFVSNQRNRPYQASCTFRIAGKVPELWHPETGEIETAPAYSESQGSTTLTLNFDSAESVFVVFRKASPTSHLRSLSARVPSKFDGSPSIVIDRARYEAADGRGADVTERVRAMVNDGELEIPATNSVFGDPVSDVVKRLVVEYRLNGKPYQATVGENDTLSLVASAGADLQPKPFSVKRISDHAVEIASWNATTYDAVDASGRHHTLTTASASSLPLAGTWHVDFPPKLGAPASATFNPLVSWTKHSNPGVKYFSGSATYRKQFEVPSSFLGVGKVLRLDLGQVKNFATIALNGHPLAVLWKPPFSVDVTGLVHPGKNRLVIKVTNLWPNRIIGDEQLPSDVEWDGDHLKRWPDWLVAGKPRPQTGRVTFETWRYYTKDSPLLDSGLLGPVTLRMAKTSTLRF